MGEIRIGISGWTYPLWRGRFYPRGWRQHRELEYAARQVSSIEINGSFYSLQRPESYRAWYEATPEGFVFSIKGSLSAKGAGWLVPGMTADRLDFFPLRIFVVEDDNDTLAAIRIYLVSHLAGFSRSDCPRDAAKSQWSVYSKSAH